MKPQDFFKDAKVGDRAYYFVNTTLYTVEVRTVFNDVKYTVEWRKGYEPNPAAPISMVSASTYIFPLYKTPEEARDAAIDYETGIIEKLRGMKF